MGAKTKETAPTLIMQGWEFMQNQHEKAERRELKLGTIVLLENGTIIAHFWKNQVRGILNDESI